MNNQAAYSRSISTGTTDDAALRARVQMLRAAIECIPASQRAAVFAQLTDVLPEAMRLRLRAPHRGGEVLTNVFELFRNSPTETRDTADVVFELAKKGKPADAQPVRLAMNYLNSRRILRRVGYGKYQLEDGSIVDGLP